VRAPALIWYHGPEAVGWQGDGRAVRFLSCAFACPGLAPPPIGGRVVAAPPAAVAAFRALEAAGRAAGDLRGALALQAAACRWLDALLDAFRLGGEGDLWDHAERLALAARDRPTVADLAARLAVSVSTLERTCRARHGCPPGVRLRHLRLAHARALAAHGGLGRAAVARMVGYADRRSLRRALQPPG
jgi:AraC-like DNA-binding protein